THSGRRLLPPLLAGFSPYRRPIHRQPHSAHMLGAGTAIGVPPGNKEDTLALRRTLRTPDRGDMHEHAAAAIIGLDEAKAPVIVPALQHTGLFHHTSPGSVERSRYCAAIDDREIVAGPAERQQGCLSVEQGAGRLDEHLALLADHLGLDRKSVV